MDAHFHEYLAAIAGMHDIYGDFDDDHPSEFHQPLECRETVTAASAVAAIGADSHSL